MQHKGVIFSNLSAFCLLSQKLEPNLHIDLSFKIHFVAPKSENLTDYSNYFQMKTSLGLAFSLRMDKFHFFIFFFSFL